MSLTSPTGGQVGSLPLALPGKPVMLNKSSKTVCVGHPNTHAHLHVCVCERERERDSQVESPDLQGT